MMQQLDLWPASKPSESHKNSFAPRAMAHLSI